MKKHIHKYIHPPPNGRESIGKCSCGKKDLAYNSTEYNIWKGKRK